MRRTSNMRRRTSYSRPKLRVRIKQYVKSLGPIGKLYFALFLLTLVAFVLALLAYAYASLMVFLGK